MKKIISIIFVFALIVSLQFPTTDFSNVLADENGQIKVTSSFEDRRGRTAELSVLLTNVEGIAAGSFELYYNPNVGYVQATEQGELLKDVMYVENTEGARDGVIKVAWAGTEVLDKEGNLLNFDFRVMHSYQETNTALELHNVKLFDINGDEINVEVLDGYVKPFDGKKKDQLRNINPDKSWTISFNTPMKRNTLNPHTVYITNDRTGARVPTKVSLSKDKMSVTIKPLGNYSKGSYTLTISDQALSTHGDRLKEAVQQSFTVN